MTESDRMVLDLASRILDYPDQEFFSALPELRQMADESLHGTIGLAFHEFIDELERDGTDIAQQKYVAVYDHDPATSLYLAWHRYGNDRGQGKALAALNGLYRAAGLEPVFGSMPDYLPRMLEFMAVSDEWAVEVILDGFGPEINRIVENLENSDPGRGRALDLALAPLRERWPQFFRPREGRDPTIRPMARPEPEISPCPLESMVRLQSGQEENL